MLIPTPLMVQTSAEPPPSERKDAPGDPGKRKHDEIDTIATRPIETPAHRKGAPPSPPAPSRGWVIPALGAACVVLGVLLWQARGSGGGGAIDKTTPPASSTATAAAPSVSPSATAISAGAASPPPSVSSAPTVAAAASGAPATTASAVERAGKATVTLLGDPGTRVSIDGASRGACPAKVALEPGQHEARFTFDPTGESRGERFSVKPGEKITVRADFTGAAPTVRIDR